MAFDLYALRPFHLAFSLAIPFNAHRKGSLNTSGAILAGTFAATTLFLCPTLVFAASLLVFFFAGSRATKYKADVKATLEETEHDAKAGTLKASSENNSKRSKKDLTSGNRDAYQVACNGLVGTLACLAWMWRFGTFFSYQAGEAVPCPVTDDVGENFDMRVSNGLVFAAVGFWSACMGDTLASELGMLASTKPFLITSGRQVPPGTNGGVTPWGTLVSALGGTFIASVALACLAFENNTCVFSLDTVSGLRFGIIFIAMGTGAGLVGSLLDSLLGATLQETLYSETSKKIVHSRDGHGKEKIVRLQGTAVLSNNGVNAVSSSLTALLCGALGWYI